MNIKAFSFVALATAVLVSCGGGNTEEQAKERIATVATSTIKVETVSHSIELSSTLEGYLSQNVAPSLTGKIEHIFVEVGTPVSEGTLLVRMDQNQLNTAKLTFANLGVEVSRMETLIKTGAVSQQVYDQTKLSYDQTAENLSFLEKNTFIKAPFSGVVSEKNYEDGELYSGQPILTITQIATLKALVAVSESYFPLIKKGMQMDIQTDIYPGETFKGSIEVVYPTIDAASHTFQCKLKINNSSLKLRPGMYVKTSLPLGEVESLVVPYLSVLKMTGSNDRYVFIDKDGVAKRVFVKLGQRYDEMIEVFSDELKEGDRIVTLGQTKLVDEAKIKVIKEN